LGQAIRKIKNAIASSINNILKSKTESENVNPVGILMGFSDQGTGIVIF
jgi:hypothetical protein